MPVTLASFYPVMLENARFIAKFKQDINFLERLIEAIKILNSKTKPPVKKSKPKPRRNDSDDERGYEVKKQVVPTKPKPPVEVKLFNENFDRY
jgi:hypothetical protein